MDIYNELAEVRAKIASLEACQSNVVMQGRDNPTKDLRERYKFLSQEILCYKNVEAEMLKEIML